MQIENINDAYFVKQNDTLTEIHFRILNDLDEPVDLTVFSRIEIIVGNDTGRLLTKSPVLLAGVGELSFTLDKDEIIPSGRQQLEVHMYNDEGLRHVVPSKGYYQLRVERPIDEMQAEVTTITLDYLLGIINERAVQGPQGIQGPKGDKGEQGIQGIQGPKGEQGIQGPKGDKGDRGPEGPKGDRGLQGEAGTGVTIKGSFSDESELPASGELGDAYMVNGSLYVWNGSSWENVGSIKGPKGEQGERGPEGPEGPKGDKGDKGDRGPEGPIPDVTAYDNHLTANIDDSEVHGIRVTDGKFQYLNGTEWVEVQGGGGSAEELSISDDGNYFTSDNVEGALQEIGEAFGISRLSLISSTNGILGG